jgi:heptaprenylglyceryl phosphate synthase
MDDKELVLSHALAGQYMGNKLIYFDCGSGAETMIDLSLLSYLKSKLTIPIIVGGGIKSYKNVLDLSNAGASYIVIGNVLENNSYLTN